MSTDPIATTTISNLMPSTLSTCRVTSPGCAREIDVITLLCEAREAARGGDCARVLEIAAEVRERDPFVADVELAACLPD